ncbi:hypothetical protein [Halalkalibaculum sp. DA384]|uniref:hypothetical protein n=1 Tax=Halalkalibaculum sp. DA384 TaxID=3373606 RepID=UPI0037546C39
MDQEWVNKSITERVEWYNNELNSLFDYLSGKEPYEDLEMINTSSEILKNIKERMKMDITSTLAPKNDTTNTISYYQLIWDAYQLMPNNEESRKKWFEKLDRANEIILKIS